MALIAHNFAAALECAKDLVARREHSALEVRQKLHLRGCADVADAVVNSLTVAGIIDDERYARVWVTARIGRKAEGRRRLVAELVKRGVASLVAEAVVDDELPAAAEQGSLLSSVKALRVKGCSRPVIVRRLLAKGFSPLAVQRITALDLDFQEPPADP